MRSLLGISVVYLLAVSVNGVWWENILNQVSSGDNVAVTSCSCGATAASKRLVNGKAVTPNNYPFMVSLVMSSNRKHFCGASIITNKVALTAAHCTHGQTFGMSVIAGTIDISKRGPGSQESRVERVIEHNDYSQTFVGIVNDIALLVLQTPLRFNVQVAPVCMPASKLNLENQMAKIIGWGKTGYMEPTSPILLEIDVRVQTAQQCRASYPFYQDSTTICSGNPKATACMGDSGGPVIWVDPETNRHTLVGLVSYAQSGCIASVPTVQTDVSAFLPWIQAIVPDYCHKN